MGSTRRRRTTKDVVEGSIALIVGLTWGRAVAGTAGAIVAVLWWSVVCHTQPRASNYHITRLEGEYVRFAMF